MPTFKTIDITEKGEDPTLCDMVDKSKQDRSDNDARLFERRALLKGAAAAAAVALVGVATAGATEKLATSGTVGDAQPSSSPGAISDSFSIDRHGTAVVFIDPQTEVLSE